MNIPMPNQTQIETTIRWLLTTGGPLGAYLMSQGATQSQINTLLTIALAVVPPLISYLWGLFRSTDKANVDKVAAMPAADKAAAMAKLPEAAQTGMAASLPDKTVLAAANAMPDVVAVVTKTGATDGVAAATADPALPKVMSETSAPKP